MARAFPPAIEALARKHGLGTPVKRYTQLGGVLVFYGFIACLIFLDLPITLALFGVPEQGLSSANEGIFEVVVLGSIGFSVLLIKDMRSTYFYLCTKGFLELNRGRDKHPTVKRALRWGQVRSTRLTGRYHTICMVTDTHGTEFQLKSRAIWNRCDEEVRRRRSGDFP